MGRNRRCLLLQRDTCAQSDYCMVRREEMIKGRYLRTLSDALSVPAGTLEWKRLEGQGKASLFLRSPSWAGRLEPSLDQYPTGA